MTRPVIIEMAGDAAGVPEGWRLVPVEPTPEMIAAAGLDCTTGSLRGAWADMLAAAPALPSEPAPKTLTDEQIDRIAENCAKSMPDGIRGFCRAWGWQQFARELLDVCAGHVPAPAAAQATPERAEAQATGAPSDAWEALRTAAAKLLCEPGYPKYRDEVRTALAGLMSQATGAQADAPTLPDTCDGKEQDAFEAWAKAERYNMELHPLHWLFLNERTHAARQGWKAGLLYAVAQMRAAQAPAAATGAQADAWRPMDAAPLDGTLVRLLVKFDAHGIEDTDEPAITIGSHNDGEWNFVGWDWHRDEWTRGSGDLLGWLPLVEAQAPAAAVPPALTHQPTQEN